MIAGSLGLLSEPATDPLEGFAHEDHYPALQVEKTQATHDDATPQTGIAAKRITKRVADVDAGTDQDGDPYVEQEYVESVQPIATEWVADVTGSGVVLAESLYGDAKAPFPFTAIWHETDIEVERQVIDVEAMHDAWEDEDSLEVWMTGSDEDGAAMQYHEAADTTEHPPTIGLGFKHSWNGTVIRGVAYDSGYLALYSATHAAEGLRFVADELLPYASEPEESGDEQATLEEAIDTSGNGEARTPDADACERCGGGELHGLEPRGGIMLCNVCRDALDERIVTMDEIREEVRES